MSRKKKNYVPQFLKQRDINSYFVLYQTLLHLPPLRFHCVGGCCDRTQNYCDFGIGRQTLKAQTTRLDLIQIKNLTSICWQQRSRPSPYCDTTPLMRVKRKSMSEQHFFIGNLSNTHGRHWIMD